MMRTSLIATGLAAVFVLAGCNGGGDKSNENSTAPAPGATSGTPAAKGDKLRIAVVPMGATHEYWKSMHEGANTAAAELHVEVIFRGPITESDRDSQQKTVQDFVTNKVDGIVLAPLDSKAMVKPVEDAIAAKIPVVIVDSKLEGGTPISFIATNNEKGGQLAAVQMAKVLGDKGDIVVLRHREGAASTLAREKGFLDEIHKHPNIHVLSDNQYAGATPVTAQTASQNLLSRFKKGDGLSINGIFTSNESTTFGTLRTIISNGWSGKVKFVGFDASQGLLDALKQGQIDGLIVQDPRKMGYLGVKTLVEYIKGTNKTPAATVDTGATLVTKENIDTPDIKKIIALPKE